MSRNEFLIDYSPSRKAIRDARVMEESEAISRLIQIENTTVNQRVEISQKTSNLIIKLRKTKRPDLLSQFIAEYNLNSEEGLSLMTLS